MSNIELRVFLVIHKLRQEDFSKLVGYSRQAVSNWCRGVFKIPNNIEEFCKNYEIQQRKD